MNKKSKKPRHKKSSPAIKQQQSSSNDHLLQVSETRALFSGPLPPPEVLSKYNEVHPDAAERIIAMAENESKHRRNIEQMVVQNEYREARIGQ